MTSSTQTKTAPLNLLFIRHGETQDNIDKVLQGHRDTSLTPSGHHDAQKVFQKLQNYNIDAIYHSPLLRIRQTLKPLLSHSPDIPTYADADLMGQGLGTLEGGSYDLVDLGDPRSADGESGVELFDDFVRRLKRSFARIVGVEAPKVGEEGRTVLVATHGVGITSLFKALEASKGCDGFNVKLARRGPEAFEVRYPDSEDVAKVVVLRPEELPVEDGVLDWEKIQGEPFLIEFWGKREKAIRDVYDQDT